LSARLIALNFWLRLWEKPFLARVKDPLDMRERFARTARRAFRTRADANFSEDRIAAATHTIDALWVSAGRADRRKVILYLHGGAFVAGSPATHRHLAADLAAISGARAFLPDYRLAPEHPFPAALEDVVAAYERLLNAGYDAANIALAGDSAGGGLVFSLLLEAAARGWPQPACVVAFSPITDMRGVSASLRRNARRDVMLPAQRFRDAIDFYLAGASPEDPRASPALGVFAAPPPALIQASRSEILADDAQAMAETLRKAGGDVRLEMWRRTPHAWHIFRGHLPEADDAITRAGGFIKARLGGNGAVAEGAPSGEAARPGQTGRGVGDAV
jgi:acetyl esterase/lipase